MGRRNLQQAYIGGFDASGRMDVIWRDFQSVGGPNNLRTMPFHIGDTSREERSKPGHGSFPRIDSTNSPLNRGNPSARLLWCMRSTRCFSEGVQGGERERTSCLYASKTMSGDKRERVGLATGELQFCRV